ncbi:hypothetical protein, partial [Thiolapillus sp.]|uniref:hypothetical protein n=4 Tax=Thiolapillus sp. TaxID=2017437 RepID=UPI003AF71A56
MAGRINDPAQQLVMGGVPDHIIPRTLLILLQGIDDFPGDDILCQQSPHGLGYLLDAQDGLDIVFSGQPHGADQGNFIQACLRPRERFWDIPVPIIDPAFDNLFVPQPSWSPSTTQQLRKLLAAPY